MITWSHDRGGETTNLRLEICYMFLELLHSFGSCRLNIILMHLHCASFFTLCIIWHILQVLKHIFTLLFLALESHLGVIEILFALREWAVAFLGWTVGGGPFLGPDAKNHEHKLVHFNSTKLWADSCEVCAQRRFREIATTLQGKTLKWVATWITFHQKLLSSKE